MNAAAGQRGRYNGLNRRRRGQAAAFSLLELLVVLALLGGLMALAWPALRRPLQSSGAQRAAASLQEWLAETRHRASLSGQFRLVRFQQGSGEVFAGPWRSLMADSVGFDDAGDASQATRSRDVGLHRWTLPEGVVVDAVRFGSLVPEQSGTGAAGGLRSEPIGSAASNADSFDSGDFDSGDFDSGQEASRFSSAEVPDGRESNGLSSATEGLRWYLPFLPTGQTRDAEIWLRDPASGARVRLIIDAVTGMMRSERMRNASASTTAALRDDAAGGNGESLLARVSGTGG